MHGLRPAHTLRLIALTLVTLVLLAACGGAAPAEGDARTLPVTLCFSTTAEGASTGGQCSTATLTIPELDD